ncbi:type III restriction enzyme, res subunit family protein, partial [gut metagenome]
KAERRGNSRNGGSQSIGEDIDSFLADAMKEFDGVLDEFKRAGKDELSISLVGMSNHQMEVLPRLIAAGAKVGYAYMKKGIHNFAEWAKQMRKALGGKLTDAGLSENEIDAFITEIWKSKLPIDGEIHTLEEWAGILGKAELRKKVGESLEEKRKAQLEAEPVAVKVCDRENIADTLPFLLPQQQDDVLKAETQFFDESHNDREHAFGKGYMFTNGTGTGKTYTGLGIVKRFIKQGKGRVLVLTPSQTKVGDWIKDAKNLGIDLKDLDAVAKAKKDGSTATTEKGEGAVITTYANFRQNKALLEDLFDLVVYDESHRLLENKGGIGTAGSLQHYKLSNRNEQYAYLRLQETNPIWNSCIAKKEEFDMQHTKIIERLKKKHGIANDWLLKQRGELPPSFSDKWTDEMEQKYPGLAKLRKEIIKLDAKYEKEVKPELERQAKENMKHTKVVFLSATPFNTRENLEYVEGYIFSYPKNDKQVGYANQDKRSQFYLEHFGAGYRWRYNRLESSTSNAEAVSKQEVEFSDYLQHTLQTMSGRIIDSPYDYSRDFPTITMEKAESFNNAMEELSSDEATGAGYWNVMGDYNYTSALFESMKVSQIIPRLKEHLKRGRKVVVFHRRVDSKESLQFPFNAIFAESLRMAEQESDAQKKTEKKKRIASLKRKYADLLAWEQKLDLRMPREQLADAFGKDNVLFFSGKESKKAKDKAVADFNSDTSGKNIIVIQEASGKEGISLHDTTGEHQRVLVTLALPQSPITALQIEGRIYRIGNKSNAIFEYPLLGLNAELILFGQKFNQQVSTTENLALGSQARNLRESFARGVEEHSGNVDIDSQGVGGKELDAPNATETDAFDRAVLDYYTNQKLKGKRDNREGQDYYPTPEPLGYMMNQWGRIGEGESV